MMKKYYPEYHGSLLSGAKVVSQRHLISTHICTYMDLAPSCTVEDEQNVKQHTYLFSMSTMNKIYHFKIRKLYLRSEIEHEYGRINVLSY